MLSRSKLLQYLGLLPPTAVSMTGLASVTTIALNMAPKIMMKNESLDCMRVKGDLDDSEWGPISVAVALYTRLFPFPLSDFFSMTAWAYSSPIGR
ncbi:hypothetical protein IW262DRAFT_752068 [Armillaria fumosa]|nr:hypothetical protein IW262DRAFT_752068 [Armillaria fumosa]